VVYQPRFNVGVVGMTGYPFESFPAIFIRCGKRVLWGEPVLHGNDHNFGFRSYDVDVAVVEEGECGFKAERAAVEVHQDWDLFGGVGVEFREVEARRDGGVFGDYYVFR